MDCVVVDLVSYHFGTLEEGARDAIDDHLLGCTACLRSYLALKRQVARGVGGEVPSDAVRARLRGAVAERFRPSTLARARGWMSRPIPFYQGLAAAVLALVVAALLPAFADKTPPAAGGRYVDTARPLAESLSIY